MIILYTVVGFIIGVVIGWFLCRQAVIALQGELASTCAWCGKSWHVDSIKSDLHIQSVRDHIMTCPEHPMGIEIRKLQSKLVEIDRLLDALRSAKPRTIESYEFIFGEIYDVVKGGEK